ncbi:structural maintenance of chromosome complex subunit SmcA [Xylariales sp. PMI_506]|nr:structural maintenance of chromosome complex subunit SmcA [Xylariales sp. PMI_506]
MPSAAAARRRSRSVFQNDGDLQASEPKRRRRGYGSSDTDVEKKEAMDDEDEEDDDDDNDDNGDGQPDMPADPFTSTQTGDARNGMDTGYQPGAVVRVRLTNFVTYEDAEFFPGPNLNMVIGPNGTGKSSLVCALCLGLGYPTKVLGRAQAFGEYVTHGKDVATIEIELQKRPRDRANHVVRVEITRENNNRSWWLNGRDAPLKAVQALVRSLRIQIDNLCQFLPQEKVAEFAALTPVQLLHETLRAAAPPDMLDWQAQLKDYYKELKGVKEGFESTSEVLKGHEDRQQGLQADVDRLNERETIKKTIEDLSRARDCAEYNTARAKFQEAKKNKKQAERHLKELEEACGPTLQAVNQKQEYQARLDAVADERRGNLRDAEAGVDQAFRPVEVLDEKIKDCENTIEGEKLSFSSRREEISKCRRNITQLEAKRKNEPEPFIASDWNHKIRELEHNLREIVDEKREAEERTGEILQQGKAVANEMKTIESNINSLNSQEGQKISHLKTVAPDVAKGWAWLQENLDQFEKEVFGPPMLTCSLRDERYSSLIQSMLQQNDFLCFTTQSKSDHKKLSEQFYTNMGLSVTIRTCLSELQSFRSPMSAEEVRRLGLDGFAIDYLEGPEPVLAMLCAEKFLHSSGVALREISSEQFNNLQSSQRINTWATGQTYFRVIRRREYGPDAATTNTRSILPGRYWTDQPIDNDEKVELKKQFDAKSAYRRDLAAQLKESKEVTEKLVEREHEVNEKIAEIKKQKSELQKTYTLWTSLPDRIESEQSTLEQRQAALQECRSRIIALEAQRDELLIEKAGKILQYKNAVSSVRQAHDALLDVQIRLIEAKSDIEGLKERNVEITNRLAEKKDEINNFAHNAEAAHREANIAKAKVERLYADGEPNDIERYNAMVAGKTPQDIDNEVEAEQAKLELIHPVDPSVLRQFEKRAQDIEGLTRKKEQLSIKLDGLRNQIKELMEHFEPELDELVGKINRAFGHNFDTIKCAGEVGIHKDEDFEQWAIEIKVKFRENEALQLLNQHRQSGGERAVSTVFYLMALQSMAQAPFRCVDEINQGMDPRNERMVHERMVEIACREHTSQYFLITPKLLTNLRYDERMRVLCIASGEHVPTDARVMNFADLIQKQLALKAAA